MNNQGEASLAPGMVLGQRYKLLRLLRPEPHGEVLLVRDQVLDVDLGLKLLSSENPDFEKILDYYRREAIWGLKLHHPQILGVHQLDETAEGVFLIQEPFAGNSLWELLGHSEALTINDSLYFIEVLAQGVAYGHKQGVIHQNFNPQQVLVSATEGIKITNFAFPAEPAEIEAFPEIQAYIAPEVWQGNFPSVASNLFSLGIIGYRMLTGALPFPLLSEGALPYQISQEPVMLDRIPDALRPLFIRCLKAEPEKRFRNAADFLSRLITIREKLTPGSTINKKPSAEEVVKPTVIANEAPPKQKVNSLGPEVEIDSDWQDSAPIYRRNFWDTSVSWMTSQKQRLAELLGPEPLRHNRSKQIAVGGGAAVAFLVLSLGLGSLFTPKPNLEALKRSEPAVPGPVTPALMAPPVAQPPVLAASPSPPQESKPEPTGNQTQPAQPQPTPIKSAVPGTSAASDSAAKTKTPAPRPAPLAAAKPEKTVPKPVVTAPAEIKATKPETSPKMVKTFLKESDARNYADSLNKQGQRALVKKLSKGDKPVYQVWTTAAATSPAKQAAPLHKPKTASKTNAAKPR